MTTELREALAAAQVAPLVQKRIDPVLLEYVRRFSPLVYTLPTKEWDSTSYWFNQRTGLPQGGPVTDGGARAVSVSAYVQNSFAIKLFQIVGSVTGFAQAVTRDLIGDLKAQEIRGATKGQAWDVETWIDWGNAAATANGVQPGFDGLDVLVATYSGLSQNAIDKASDAGTGFALKYLDELIDMVEENIAEPVDDGQTYIFVSSPKLVSRVAQLLTNQQRFTTVNVAAGLVVPSYRNIGFVKSSFLSARTQAMGTITPSTATTGGTLAAGTWRYQVTAVMNRFGELVASPEISQVTAGGATSTVTLAFATPSGPDGASPILYKVWRTLIGGASGTETLLGYVDAFDTTGAATTSIIDTGSNLLTNSAGNTGPAAYTGTNTGVAPPASGYENLYLIPKDPDYLVRPFVRDFTTLPLAATTAAPDTMPFAQITDTTLAVRAPKYVGRIANASVAQL